MNEQDTSWTGRRWSSVLAVITLSHVGVFWLLAKAPTGPSILPGKPPMVARWAETAPDPLAGGLARPTRFALPDTGGFSADASTGLPRVEYALAAPKPVSKFLPANPDAGHLGTIPHTASPKPAAKVRLPEAFTATAIEPMTATRGTVEIAGLPAAIVPQRAIQIPQWTEPTAPQPIRIEFAVNPFGEVITARLTLASGSRAADLAALSAIRESRFTSRPAGTAEAFQSDRLTWGVATFHPTATNAPIGTAQTR